MERKWWQKSIVYQIYPKSFYDSNGDGIGDLRGIIEKLDYVSELGADVIWLCPVYKSPMCDNGYDISDYRNINEMFGSMEDMEELIHEAKERNIKIIMDLVVNHTSDEHPWFVASRSSKDNPYRDYYYWRKPAEGGGYPNNWRSIFGGSAWEYDETTKEYYLHAFAKKQPDLNWENPKVREEVFEMVNWWLDKGIGGFRVDAITFIKKRQDFSSVPPSNSECEHQSQGQSQSQVQRQRQHPGEQLVSITKASLNEPGIHKFLEELNTNCFSKFDIMTVAEAPGVPHVDLGKYIGDKGHFSMIFDFSHIDLDLGQDGMWYRKSEWTISDFKAAITKGQLVTEDAGWGSLYLENHDQPRCLNKYLKEEHISDKSAKMLAGFYFFLKGTPFIYQGQELGMTNVRFDSIEDYDDISSVDQYYSALKEGYSKEEALEALYRRSRDNSRTPMQWSSNTNASFTRGKPWLKVNPNFVDINVDVALSQKDSIYYFYKKLIQLRKNSIYSEVLTYGRFEPILQQYQSVIAYLRVLGNEKILVVADFGGKGAEIRLGFSVKKCIVSNTNSLAVHNDDTSTCTDAIAACTDSSTVCIGATAVGTDSSTACIDAATVCTDSCVVHTDKLVLAPYDFFVYEV